MNDIMVIKQLNKYNREQYYFSISRNYLAGLKKYIGDDYRAQYITKLLGENDGEKITIELDFFEMMLKAMLLRADLNCDKEYFQNTQFTDEYNSANEEYITIRGKISDDVVMDFSRESLINKLINDAIFDGDIDSIYNVIDSVKALVDVTTKIYKSRDLISAREIVLESLSYILSPVEVMECRSQYTELLNERPVDLNKVEAYLKSLQQIILEDWKKQTTDLASYKPGDKFKFICHSTSSETFNGDFYSNLVSCSLLTEEFTETYRSGYGFIFPPVNIVGADGRDMYVKKYIEDEENMLNCSSVPRIESVGKVLDVCRETRAENEKEGKKEKIYSEIVVKGFNPIGIFCLTAGDKELNHNYMCAKKLQEQFPHLPIIEIDLTLYKSKDVLIPYRDQLLFQLERNMNSMATKRDSSYYDNYEYFWNNFLKLKQSGDYKVTDIIALYRENDELFSMRIDAKTLLSGKYSLDAIRYTLMHNYAYGIKDILNGYFTAYELMRLKDELVDVIDNPLLEEAIPGISRLVVMLAKVGITPSNIDEIKKNQPITITSITEVLQLSINERISQNKNELMTLNSQKEALEVSYREKESTLKKHQRYYEIINHEYAYSVANMDLEAIQSQLSVEEEEKADLLDGYEQIKSEYDSKCQEREKLSKHRILNYFKLRNLEGVLRSFRGKLSIMESNLASKNEAISAIRGDITSIRSQFKEKTGIDFASYSLELSKANAEYDMGLEFNLPYTLQRIEEQISEIDTRIGELMQQQEQLQGDYIRR